MTTICNMSKGTATANLIMKVATSNKKGLRRGRSPLFRWIYLHSLNKPRDTYLDKTSIITCSICTFGSKSGRESLYRKMFFLVSDDTLHPRTISLFPWFGCWFGCGKKNENFSPRIFALANHLSNLLLHTTYDEYTSLRGARTLYKGLGHHQEEVYGGWSTNWRHMAPLILTTDGVLDNSVIAWWIGWYPIGWCGMDTCSCHFGRNTNTFFLGQNKPKLTKWLFCR